jgi:glycosyltransferase involved in cell wall biosynthesis
LKRIFHLITTLSRGGAENQLLVLVNEQIKLGFEVHVVYLKGEPELKADFESCGAMIHTNVASNHPLIQPLKFRSLIRDKHAIVHAHLPRAELIALFTPKKFLLFASRHNSEPFFPGAPKWVSNFLSKIVEFRSKKIIAISSAVRDFMLSRGEIADPESITVVPYGYTPKVQPGRTSKVTSNKLTKLGSIARLTDQKDIPTMLRAFQKYRNQEPKSSLSILGAGPLELDLKNLAQEMGIGDSVNFLGRSSDIYGFLGTLDVFILTSKYEGFGMVLLEAMDANIPIVASNNSSIPEVLGHDFPGLSATGNYLEFYENIKRLNEIDYLNKVIAIQEARLRIFNARSMAERINSVYFE